MAPERGPAAAALDAGPARVRGVKMDTSDGGSYRSGLAELVKALASARTSAEVAAALWWRREEACGATATGLATADPEVRLLSGGDGAGMLLDPLLVAEFAYASEPLFFASAAVLCSRYPVLAAVGVTVADEACAVIPLAGAGTPPGALVVIWDRPRLFGPADRGLLTALGGLCSAELARTWALDRQREVTEQLRRRLRPRWLPYIAGAEVAVRHQPAEELRPGIGFYDVFATDEGVWRLVAGNVAGSGVDAAVLAGLARQAFRRPDPHGGPPTALARLDQMVRDFGDPVDRMSAVCVDVTRRGPGFTLTVARAGHPAPLVLRHTGAVLSVDVPGGPLGRRPDPRPAELGLELRPGDALLLTAGAGRALVDGDPRFAAALTGCAGWAPHIVLEHVGLALAEHPGKVWDGTSLLAMRVHGGGPRAPAGGPPTV